MWKLRRAMPDRSESVSVSVSEHATLSEARACMEVTCRINGTHPDNVDVQTTEGGGSVYFEEAPHRWYSALYGFGTVRPEMLVRIDGA